VGGPARGRGVISSASYEARRFGVRSAMPTAQALGLCPDLVVVPPDFEAYTAASRQIMRDLPLVHAAGRAALAGRGLPRRRRLRAPVRRRGRDRARDQARHPARDGPGGLGRRRPSKFVAKLASDLDKPDGFRVIRAEEVRAVLDPLPVSKIFGVGPRTAKRLEALGVLTVADLAARPREEVARALRRERRVDPRPRPRHRLAPRLARAARSVHRQERTFPKDVSDREELRLPARVQRGGRLPPARQGPARPHGDPEGALRRTSRRVTRTKTLDFSTNLGPRIYAVARELLERVPPGPLRLIGVQVSNLEDVRTPQQGLLFGGGTPREGVSEERPPPAERRSPDARLERASAGLDRLRRKHGRGIVVPASLLGRAPTPGLDGSAGLAR
jgi:DNA polymerase IV